MQIFHIYVYESFTIFMHLTSFKIILIYFKQTNIQDNAIFVQVSVVLLRNKYESDFE